jgi:hypothetical protein
MMPILCDYIFAENRSTVDFEIFTLITITVSERLNFFMPSPEQTLPMAYSLLASMMAADEHFFKVKKKDEGFNL